MPISYSDEEIEKGFDAAGEKLGSLENKQKEIELSVGQLLSMLRQLGQRGSLVGG